MAAVQPPHAVKEGDRVGLVLAVEISMTALMLAFIATRFIFRTVVRKVWGYDDIALGAAGVRLFPL